MLKIPIEKLMPILKKYYSDLVIKKINVYYFNINCGKKLIATVNVLTNIADLKSITSTRHDKMNIVPVELINSINDTSILSNFEPVYIGMHGQYDKIVLLCGELSINDINELKMFCESMYENIDSSYLEKELTALYQAESK